MKKLIVLTIISLSFLTGCTLAKKTETPVPKTTNTEISVKDSYLKSNFRVLFIKRHPTEPYFFVVATDRIKDGEPGNDAACGSIYTQPVCYFFIEPDDYYGAPKEKFVGTYTISEQGETGAMMFDTVKFTDKKTVEFKTMSDDAGASIEVWWSLNIDTGELKELKRETKDYGV